MNKNFLLTLLLLIIFILFFTAPYIFANNNRNDAEEYISTDYKEEYFKLVYKGNAATIYIDKNEYWGVMRAVNDLQSDIKKITDVTPFLKSSTTGLAKNTIIIGTIGKSAVIDELINSGTMSAEAVAGKWESFIITVIDNPLPGIKQGLVIAGSDKRGTIYGIYDVAEHMGISPWYYWADIPPKKKKSLLVKPGTYIQGEPSVKYRGIFLNDEAPSLSGWVDATFGDYNHHFYEKVFELLLRLKANYLWPAMWDNAFSVDDTVNPELADKYGIVMGTSHHEPMMRAHKEWKIDGAGDWNYATNASTLYNFWDQGIQRNGKYENIITMGMRGDGDEPMPGDTIEEKIGFLQTVIKDQRTIIANSLNSDVTEVPQVWAIYKEVQEFYEHGMRVADDITHLWCDDNFGNLRRVPTAEERDRPGGAGIYYHFDYVGGPRSYKWVNTIPITKIWEQMNLAYKYGANKIWIVNVGDLKPMEFPISFFLSMAWDANRWDKDNLYEFALQWARKQFGNRYSHDIAHILMKYSKYNGIRKPEVVDIRTFSITDYREAENLCAQWKRIVQKAERIYKVLEPAYKDAFYQLVLYPTRTSAYVTEMHYYAALNKLYRDQGRSMTNTYATVTETLFNAEAEDTFFYNNLMAGGKWNHMMDQPHIGSKSWDGPPFDTIPTTYTTIPTGAPEMGIAVEGSTDSWPGEEECILPEFNVFVKEKHYIEIFNKGLTPFTFKAIPQKP